MTELKPIDHEKIDSLAQNFIALQNTNPTNLSFKDKRVLEKAKNDCLQDLSFLVEQRTGRYKQFSNYSDLQQEGRIAILNALKSYKPSKGHFFTWMLYYVKTKIFRQANAHSTIRVPMGIAKDTKPHKVSEFPHLSDERVDLDFLLSQKEREENLLQTISILDSTEQELLIQSYGLFSQGLVPQKEIQEKFNLSLEEYKKKMTRIKRFLRENLKI